MSVGVSSAAGGVAWGGGVISTSLPGPAEAVCGDAAVTSGSAGWTVGGRSMTCCRTNVGGPFTPGPAYRN